MVGLIVFIGLVVGGCKNPDNTNKPIIPDITGAGPTVPIDPRIPEPFVDISQFTDTILDIAIEGDGDLVFSFADHGLRLYTPYGVFKRRIGPAMSGLATSNYSSLDTGRGVMGISGDNNDCRPMAAYDDVYVTGGVPNVTYNAAWWGGEPDPYYPNFCNPQASTSSFSSCDKTPSPIAYHPETAFAYQKVYAPDCIADSDCPWPFSNSIPPPNGGYAILAYHPDAPLPPDYRSYIFEGGFDFLVYYDFPTYQNMQGLAGPLGLQIMPACQEHCLYLIWDLTTLNYMSSRSQMVASQIGDFEFDALNRLVMVLPNADSAVITDPVIFTQPIVIQKTLGGRQNGLGTLPGEFQGPTAVAIDPRNQNILISDSGNRRVQIFDNDGNFIGEFGGADQGTPFVPGALRVDAFGAIYVANVAPNRAEGDNLRIYNENGSKVTFGTIEGWVYDKDSHLPLDSTRVRVMSTFNALDTITDSKGHFIFPAVAAGTHDVTADKYGYDSGQVNVTVTGGYASKVDIFLKREMINPPGEGQITGTVFTSLYNKPVPGLTAEIVGLPISNVTNGNGEFTLYKVPEGDRTIRLTSGGTIWYEKYITVTKGEILDLGVIYLPIP
jgi:hypothetical protein